MLQVSATEETLLRLQQFHKELFALRNVLRKEALKVKGGGAHNNSSGGGDTNDSGISDASSCSSSSSNSSSCNSLDLDFPLRQQQLERLRFLAQHLQQSLQPSSKVTIYCR